MVRSSENDVYRNYPNGTLHMYLSSFSLCPRPQTKVHVKLIWGDKILENSTDPNQTVY